MLGAIIGAAATIGGSLLSSSSSKKAANQAAAAQTQVAGQNNALTRDIYNSNTANLSPFMRSGARATQMIDGFLYGAQPEPHSASIGPASPVGGGYQAPAFDLDTGATRFDGFQSPQPTLAPQQFGAPVPAQSLGGTVQASVPPQNPWDTFRNSTNYQFRFNEGLKALGHALGAGGMTDSGAARKAEIRYGQDFASNEFNRYMDLLRGQQGVGVTGASAVAGVGQNMVDTVSRNNQNAADATSNAALMRGAANGQLYGGIANALGGLASSYRK